MSASHENEDFMLFLETIWQMEPTDQKKLNGESAWERYKNRFQFEEDPDWEGSELAKENEVLPIINKKQFGHKSITGFSSILFTASILIDATFSFLFFDVAESEETVVAGAEIEYREISSKRGERSKITLSDGSIIHLNGDNFLRIPRIFNDDASNTVYLEGEALFEINRDESAVFQVVADETVTTVLGTRFNVRSYQEAKEVTVVVVKGSVSLGYLHQPEFEQAILTKNQKGGNRERNATANIKSKRSEDLSRVD